MTLKNTIARAYGVPTSRVRATTPLSELSADPHAHIRLALTLNLSDETAGKIELHPEKWTLEKLTKAIEASKKQTKEGASQ